MGQNLQTVMSRTLATLVLLVPLSLNGLWMVCAESPTGLPVQDAPEAAPVEVSSAAPHCSGSMCPLEKPAETGAICLLSSTGDGSSIAAFAFVVAAPASAVSVIASERSMAERSEFATTLYADASLNHTSPPPRA